MEEIRETIRGVRCPKKTLLAYSQARGCQHIWMSTGAQGLAGTQIKDSPLSFHTKGLTAEEWDTLWDVREKQFQIAQD